MKFFALISVLLSAAALTACGNDDQSDSATAADAAKITTTRSGTGEVTAEEVKGVGAKPTIEARSGPPPEELEVESLQEGAGKETTPGDKLGVRYVGTKYKTGQIYEDRWGPEAQLSFTLGNEEVVDGWEEGLDGIKLGGRRELVIPSKLAFGNGDLIYVVELLTIE